MSRELYVITALLLSPIVVRAQQPSPIVADTIAGAAGRTALARAVPGNPETGQRLFAGEIPFRMGGPSCASCHRAGGIGFPGGGTLGPDLSGIYDRLGPPAMVVILQTLYFPTMNPIFAGRLLAPDEQSDLLAFLRRAPPGTAIRATPEIIVIAVVAFILLLIVIEMAWRHRLGAVRRDLVRPRARGTGR